MSAGLSREEKLARLRRKLEGALHAPLTALQRQLWFIERLGGGGAVYNMAGGVRLRGPLDAEALEAALGDVARRHEILRTTFEEREGEPRQVVGPATRAPLPRLDLAGEPGAERSARARATALGAEPFDPSAAPPWRAELVRIAPDDHLLAVVFHHLLNDGWGIGVFARDLAAFYAARAGVAHEAPPPMPVQFADYARWQRERQGGDDVARQVDHWRERLAGCPTFLALPTDRPRPPEQSFRGAKHYFDVDAALTSAIEALARREGATLFVALMAAFAALLHRLSGQQDFVVATPAVNRRRPELEPLVGPIVDTLPLRLSFAGAPSAREAVGRVREAWLDAWAHPDVPLARLLGELRVARDPSHNPLFQTLFVLHTSPPPALRVGPLELESVEVDNGTSRFDLSLSAVPRGGGLRAWFEYDGALFDAETVARFARQFERLLRAAVESPDRPVASLDLADDGERERARAAGRGPSRPGHRDELVPDAFRRRAAERPDTPALAKSTLTLSYNALARASRRLAAALRERGVRPGDAVALALEPSAAAAVAVLAALEAGATYVPLDPSAPAARIREICEVARPRALLAPPGAPPPGAEGLPLLAVDAATLTAGPDAAPAPAARPDAPAYVLFTSGSTGRPKGVVVGHAALANYVAYAARTYGTGPGSHSALHTPLSFDLTITSLLPPLCAGGALEALDRDGGLAALAAFVDRRGDAARVKLTPAHLALLADGLRPSGASPVFVVGGEALGAATVRALRRRLPAAVVYNEYGPTEATVGCCVHRVGDPDAEAERLPIGRPLDNVDLAVLDPSGRAAPFGAVGELYVGGAGLADGYLGEPGPTAERFVEINGERRYRTGDLARLDAAGVFHFVGRADRQIKLHGFRIEPGEVEAALRAHPGVRQSAVVLRAEDGRPRLVGYVEADAADERALRAWLQERLPRHLVPAQIVALARLPLTANGKVDFGALPAPAEPAARAAPSADPAEGPEAQLAALWREVLRIERVGRDDNFFDLGGDSIAALQVTARAREAGLRLAPKLFFRHQTLAALAAAAEPVGECGGGTFAGPAPLGPAQHWFFDLPLSDRDWWSQTVLLELEAPVDDARLRGALAALVEAHPSLRARYRTGAEGAWEQEILARAPAPAVERAPLGPTPEASVARAGGRAQRSISLAEGRLVAAAYLEAAAGGRDLVLLAAHHLAVDGVSWRTLLLDLARALGGEPAPSAPAASYRAWVDRLRAFAADERLRAQAAHWTSALWEQAAPLPLRSTEAPGLEGDERATTEWLGVGETDDWLQRSGRAYGTRPDELLLAAVARALCSWAGRGAVAIDVEGHGRADVFDGLDVSSTVGWFTSIYPLLLRAGPELALGDAIVAVKEAKRGAPDEGLPFLVARYLCLDATVRERLARLPARAASFNYLGRLDRPPPGAPFRLSTLDPGPARAPENRRTHPLAFGASVRDGRLALTLRYDPASLGDAEARGLARRTIDELRAALGLCLGARERELSPSDFPAAKLDKAQLTSLLRALGGGKK